MKIYQLGTREQQAYLAAPNGDDDQCDPDVPRSMSMDWKSPQFELVTDDVHFGRLPKCDFPHYLPSAPMLSHRAVVRLRPLLLTCGELLPIDVTNDDDAFYLFNVTRIVDAIDMRRSQFARFPSGKIMLCELLIFDPRLIPDEPIFFKTTQMGPATDIYATEKARTTVEATDLTGYEFRLAWSDE